ncbi:MAG: DNA alkylation repair protein [Spirosomataceae bacterium]
MLATLQEALQNAANSERAAFALRYFKAGKGEYAEGDVFLGITNPALRATIKPYTNLSFEELQELLNSPWHEYRMAALLILVRQYQKGALQHRRHVVEFYLANVTRINNWDLVDCSARDILGAYLFDKDRSILFDLAQTNHLWSQRIAIIATAFFIQKSQFDETLALCEYFLTHKHDLIHKATGWMLREVGKKDGAPLRRFLNLYASQMPRTMLRYAIEKFPELERLKYLKGEL